jgi:hypothetical protein
MRTIKALVVALLGTLGLGCSAAPAQSLSLEEIVARNVEARGGAAALDNVRQIAIEPEIHEAGNVLRGRYAADPAGLVRIDIYADGKLVFREGVDAEGVWLWPAGKPEPEPSKAEGAANALLNGAEMHLFGLHRYAERGHALTLMPSETIEGVTYHVVRAALGTGHTVYFYLDPKSWQIVRRRDERAYHPDVDQTRQRIETRFSDFRTVSGVVFPFYSEDVEIGGRKLGHAKVLSLKINPGLAPSRFDRRIASAPELPR